MADYGSMQRDTTLQTLTGTRDALRASFKDLNDYYEPELEELIHKVSKFKMDVLYETVFLLFTFIFVTAVGNGALIHCEKWWIFSSLFENKFLIFHIINQEKYNLNYIFLH